MWEHAVTKSNGFLSSLKTTRKKEYWAISIKPYVQRLIQGMKHKTKYTTAGCMFLLLLG